MARLHTHLGIGWLLSSCLVGSWACSDSDVTRPLVEGDGTDRPIDTEVSVPGDGDSEFVSSLPNGAQNERGALSAETDSGANPTAPPSANGEEDGGAARAISEADILQLSGDRLYALSRYSGLSIIDASDPSRLRLEGVYRSAAEPFEMYVEDGLVYAMFNSWYSYVCDDATGACSWQTQSRVQALDTRDPANIRLLTDLEVPGNISDSRRVGDVLYLATQQWNYCWGCESEANTTLTSFDLSDPAAFREVDQLRLPLPAGSYGGDRSIAVTDQRIYIAGQDYGNNGPLPGSVQVVDITDPGGALELGSRFSVAGPIQSRWQMDEYDGVFRVISQPGGWGTDQPPVVQTFRVTSATDISAAGTLTVTLPRPNEVLQSVRFDGARGYAITAEQRDPLFTFDLSDPAAPQQLGELEMPGWVYHMEPRGNRMYALGFDAENPEGSLHVSQFDVTNLAEPLLLSRVAFGGDWGSFAEGQNQIHKAFSILPDQGLIMVPFSGGSYDENSCVYEYGSGIQLVDFTENTLTRRGVAPQVGNARRAFLHREHLFGVGDNAVQTFDISDRDAPIARGQLDVARNVSTVRVLGDHLLRFGNDWATQQTILDMTPTSQANRAEPEAEIDLSALFGEDAWSCNGGSYWGGQVFTRGNYAYVPRYSSWYGANYSTSEQRLTFYIVDLTDRGAPRAVGKFAVEPATDGSYISDIIQTESTLLVGRSVGQYTYTNMGQITGRPNFYYDVIELSNPAAPTVATRFEVPELISGGGWGQFIGGCAIDMEWGWGGYYGRYYGGNGAVTLTDGDLVVSQHSEPVPGTTDQVKYYLDRIDVSNPQSPRMLPKINIPGTAIHFNGETGELVTVDYQTTIEPATSWEDCAARGAYAWYEQTPAQCSVTRRSINSLLIQGDRAVRQSQLYLDRSRRTGNIAVSDSRIFYTTSELPVYENSVASSTPVRSGEAVAPPPTAPITLEALRLSGGQLTRLPSEELRRQPNNAYYYGELFARGDRAFEIYDNTVTVVDTAEPMAPARLSHEIPSWGCQSLEVSADTAYCAVGQRGVEVIDLSSMR